MNEFLIAAIVLWLGAGFASIPIATAKTGMAWPPPLHLLGGPIILIAVLLMRSQ